MYKLIQMFHAFVMFAIIQYIYVCLLYTSGLAYKSCRGVYELMTGNTYEGIRILKAAKAEGSEEAAYNLNVFFEHNKRP